MAKGIWVKVSKWSDYAGRTDVVNHTWFRCSNRILEDEDFFEFSDAEILGWLYILSLCSQKKTDTVPTESEKTSCRQLKNSKENN
jgi:hypothetical protein